MSESSSSKVTECQEAHTEKELTFSFESEDEDMDSYFEQPIYFGKEKVELQPPEEKLSVLPRPQAIKPSNAHKKEVKVSSSSSTPSASKTEQMTPQEFWGSQSTSIRNSSTSKAPAAGPMSQTVSTQVSSGARASLQKDYPPLSKSPRSQGIVHSRSEYGRRDGGRGPQPMGRGIQRESQIDEKKVQKRKERLKDFEHVLIEQKANNNINNNSGNSGNNNNNNNNSGNGARIGPKQGLHSEQKPIGHNGVQRNTTEIEEKMKEKMKQREEEDRREKERRENAAKEKMRQLNENKNITTTTTTTTTAQPSLPAATTSTTTPAEVTVNNASDSTPRGKPADTEAVARPTPIRGSDTKEHSLSLSGSGLSPEPSGSGKKLNIVKKNVSQDSSQSPSPTTPITPTTPTTPTTTTTPTPTPTTAATTTTTHPLPAKETQGKQSGKIEIEVRKGKDKEEKEAPKKPKGFEPNISKPDANEKRKHKVNKPKYGKKK